MFDMKKRLSKRAETILGPNSNASIKKQLAHTQQMKNFPIKTLNFYINNTISLAKIPNAPVGSNINKSSIMSPDRSKISIKKNFNSQSTLDRPNKLMTNRIPIGGM